MERVLRTVELVSQIMEAAGKHRDRSGLVSCVRVNQLFSQEAIRILWRALQSLDPFYFVLPSDAVSLARLGSETKVIRQLDNSDWKRALKYALLVHRLDYSFNKHCLHMSNELSKDLHLLEAYQISFPDRPFGPFLPNLVEIVTPRGYRTDNLIPGPLFMPHLRILDLNTAVYPKDWLSETGSQDLNHRLVRDAICKMTELRSLNLRGPSVVHANTLKALLHGKPCLRELHLPNIPIDSSHITLVRSLSGLQTLSIETKHIVPNSMNPNSLKLQSLKTLALMGPLETNLAVIQDIGIRPSEKLSFSSGVGQPSNETITAALDVIAKFSAQTLQSLSIEFHPGHEDFGTLAEYLVIPTACLQPLYVLRSLRSLELQLWWPLDLFNEEIPEIMEAFPCMTNLELNNYPQEFSDEYTPRLSPSCLLAFAGVPSRLEKISFLMNSDWRGLQEDLDEHLRSESQPVNLQISVIDIGASNAPEVETDPEYENVARMLKEMFPALDELRFSSRDYIERRGRSGLADDSEQLSNALKWCYISDYLPNRWRQNS